MALSKITFRQNGNLPVQYFYESDDKDEEEYRSALSNLYVPAQVYVDALFGVGLSRKVSGVYRAAIEEWKRNIKKKVRCIWCCC